MTDLEEKELYLHFHRTDPARKRSQHGCFFIKEFTREEQWWRPMPTGDRNHIERREIPKETRPLLRGRYMLVHKAMVDLDTQRWRTHEVPERLPSTLNAGKPMGLQDPTLFGTCNDVECPVICQQGPDHFLSRMMSQYMYVLPAPVRAAPPAGPRPQVLDVPCASPELMNDHERRLFHRTPVAASVPSNLPRLPAINDSWIIQPWSKFPNRRKREHTSVEERIDSNPSAHGSPAKKSRSSLRVPSGTSGWSSAALSHGPAVGEIVKEAKAAVPEEPKAFSGRSAITCEDAVDEIVEYQSLISEALATTEKYVLSMVSLFPSPLTLPAGFWMPLVWDIHQILPKVRSF